MALSVAITRILYLAPDKVFLQWDIRGAVDSGSYNVDVHFSQGPAGPWHIVTTGADMYHAVHSFQSTPLPLDARYREPNQMSMARQPYYRVTVTPPSGILDQVSVVTEIEPNIPLRQRNARRKMLRDARVLLIKGNGTPVAVCKRARWGAKCADCVDIYTGDIVHGECLTCFGTGYVPGFMQPVITYARRGPNATQAQVSEAGKTETNVVSITLLNVPKVQDDDMIVFLHDNARFLVRASGQTELKISGVHQELMATEIAHNGIEYRFPVDPYTTPALF